MRAAAIISIILLALACQTSIPEPAQTQTAAPARAPTAANPPTETPQPAETPTPAPSPTPTPTAGPPCLEVDGRGYPEDCLAPEAAGKYRSALEAAASGDIQKALELMQEARDLQPAPSGHLEMMLGQMNALLDRREQALQHMETAIAVRDDGLNRVMRAIQLGEWERCRQAQEDARAALELEPHGEPGFHTFAEAHRVLARCAWVRGETELGHRHMTQAHRIAREHGYSFAVPDGPDSQG